MRRLERAILASDLPFEWQWISGATYDDPTQLRDITTPHFVLNWPPTGATAPLNRVFRLAKGKYVVLLADDIEPYPQTLRRAVEFMEDHPAVGQGALYFRQLSHPERCHVSPWHGWLYANFFIIRREVGDQVGWFEPSCSHYAVDNDLSAKVLSAGYGVVAIPGACLKDHNPRDDHFHMNNHRSMRDSQDVIEPKWKEKQPELKRIWETKWKALSGPYECSLADHNL